MKIRKISILVFGCIFALAMIINQLVNYVAAYALNLFPLMMTYLGQNIILARTVGFIIILVMGFLIGIILALVYNLIAKSKKFRLVLETG